jgi:hypothetical protein
MLALLPAELLLVSRFGWIMAALIFAALIADIIFLPALLGGSLGRLIQRAEYNRDSVGKLGGKAGAASGPDWMPPTADAATSFRPAAEVVPKLN